MGFKLEFSTGNAAFEDYPEDEITRILRTVSTEIHDGKREGIVRDVNGNTVGSYEVTED